MQYKDNHKSNRYLMERKALELMNKFMKKKIDYRIVAILLRLEIYKKFTKMVQ